MSNNFARHEQFLRIFAVLDALSDARQPLEDQALIAAIQDRLGLTRLSPRTLRRDCEFLASCGYPVEHKPLPGSRKYGWCLDRESVGSRQVPPDPLTLLELVSFAVARDLLRDFEGTVLWTGIESLRNRLERGLPTSLKQQFAEAQRAFHVAGRRDAAYASRPRLLSTLSAAINDRRAIELLEHPTDTGVRPSRHLLPHCLVIRPPRMQLLAFAADGRDTDPPLLIDLERIDKVVPLDGTFAPRQIDIAAHVAASDR